MTIYTLPCLVGLVLCLRFRQPLLLTGNIFVLIFIVSLQGRLPFAELAWASMVAGVAVVAITALGLADKLARLIPRANRGRSPGRFHPPICCRRFHCHGIRTRGDWPGIPCLPPGQKVS
ncbi:hypothetical protein [Arthrobacter sp. R1-13]